MRGNCEPPNPLIFLAWTGQSNVRFILPAPKAVLHLRDPVDRAGSGPLVRFRRRIDRLVGPEPIGVNRFWTARSLWFDLYFAISVAVFAAAWTWFAPHPWATWSIGGSALILFATYFQVQVNVVINDWFGPFYNLVQTALTKSRPVTLGSSTATYRPSPPSPRSRSWPS